MIRFRVDFYHADRTAKEKARVHREWSAGRIHLICATIAFGMGEWSGVKVERVRACVARLVGGRETGWIRAFLPFSSNRDNCCGC